MPVENTSTTRTLSTIPATGLVPAVAAPHGPRRIRPHGPRRVHPDGPRAELERLGDRIAELSARIQAATYELLVLIRQFDERNGWSSCASCAHWLSWRTGLAPGAAREHVRVARALGNLARLSDAMRRGVVSYSKVRAVTRVATLETEQALLDVALCGTAAHVEQIVRGWRRVDRTAEAAEDRRRHETRSLRTWVDDDGMVVVRGRLTPEVGALLRRALEAACDHARARRAPGSDAGADAAPVGSDASVEGAAGVDAAANEVAEPADVLAPSFAQRQADAIGVVAECALAGGLDRGAAGDRYQVVVHVDADALVANSGEPRRSEMVRRPNERTAGAAARGGRGAAQEDVPAGTSAASYTPGCPGRPDRPDRPDRVAQMPAGSAFGEGDVRRMRQMSARGSDAVSASSVECVHSAPSQTVLDEAGGIHVSPETARRLACDAATVAMRHGPDGEILDVGRRTRTISPALRRALAARDRQCRFPGCQNRRCDAHHVRHWADGGATALDNLLLLCRRHHRMVHEDGFSVTIDAGGEVQFVRPDGRLLAAAPPAPAWSGLPLAPVTARLEQEEIAIGPNTATPAWRGERLDVGWAVGVLWRPSG